MLGLTGTPGQVAKAAKAFRVFFQEVDKEADSEDYLGECFADWTRGTAHRAL
jgi:cytochrome oxidase Cu insertion factor (SCO1/SenC/PrrC family)